MALGRALAGMALAAALPSLLAGCGVTRDPGFVAREWDSSMRELNIYPLFPPREDVQVGDLYVVLADAKDGPQDIDYGTPGIWLDSLLTRDLVEAFYDARANLPQGLPAALGPDGNPVAAGGSAVTPTPLSQVVSATPPDNAYRSADPLGRLRLVQFPAFSLALLDESQIGLAAPSLLGGLLGGIGDSDDLNLSLSVPQAESYALPANALIDLLQKQCAAGKPVIDPARVALAGDMLRRPGDATGTPVLTVISEVFYTRTLDYTFSRQSGFGIGAAAGSAATGSQPVPGTDTGSTTDTAAGTDIEARLAALETQVNGTVSAAGGQTLPGARGSITFAGDRSIRLSQSFERPIAIGYRALFVRTLPDCGLDGYSSYVASDGVLLTAGQQVLGTVLFDRGAATVDPSDAAAIAAHLAAAGGPAAARAVTVEASAEPDEGQGDPGKLAAARAQAVASVLTSAGLPASAVTTVTRQAPTAGAPGTGASAGRSVRIVAGGT
ncbi:hypothetical protein [Arenibaculum sp.]|jgi:outer membrane protein OmpA-like peptidoglycan-associated protein|uniref:hypothetical protein n=1 Tax=Arenibaculum sp. TaxID=2865862 RepID=UPI002E11E335|nr:hypothetical protein [Arenibaculum sp.]